MQQKRPLAITIICLIAFLALGVSLFMLPSLYRTLTTTYASWYGPVWLASLALSVVSLIGYWRMKKWGVFLYILTAVGSTVIGLQQGLPFTWLNLAAPLLVSILGLVYLRRMT